MFGNRRRGRELEEELGRCREENRFLLNLLSNLEEGVVLLEDGKVRYISKSGKRILEGRSLEDMGEDVEIVARGDSFIVFKRKEERPAGEDIEKGVEEDSLTELKNLLEPIFEDINRLSSQTAASFTELDERAQQTVGEHIEDAHPYKRDLGTDKPFSPERGHRGGACGRARKGFAMVAEEVRRLAGKTMKFTENIDSLLKDVEKKVSQTKEHIEELFYLVQYRMEALRSKYEEVSSKPEVLLNLIQDTRCIIENKLSGKEA